jgi:MANEC domain
MHTLSTPLQNPGSCYLFDCGPTDDFKCKFHAHGHYVSGVMTVNRQAAVELESQLSNRRPMTSLNLRRLDGGFIFERFARRRRSPSAWNVLSCLTAARESVFLASP